MGSMSEATLTIFLSDTRVTTIARRALSGISQDVDPSGYAAMMAWVGIVMLAYICAGQIKYSNRKG
jgi:ABC-type spermidine/putrescine transport system permease subunit II